MERLGEEWKDNSILNALMVYLDLLLGKKMAASADFWHNMMNR